VGRKKAHPELTAEDEGARRLAQNGKRLEYLPSRGEKKKRERSTRKVLSAKISLGRGTGGTRLRGEKKKSRLKFRSGYREEEVEPPVRGSSSLSTQFRGKEGPYLGHGENRGCARPLEPERSTVPVSLGCPSVRRGAYLQGRPDRRGKKSENADLVVTKKKGKIGRPSAGSRRAYEAQSEREGKKGDAGEAPSSAV